MVGCVGELRVCRSELTAFDVRSGSGSDDEGVGAGLPNVEEMGP